MTRRPLAAFLLCLSVAPAAAQGAPDWQVTVMPYVWAPGVSGSIRPTAASPTFSFSQSIGESLSVLDAAAFAMITAQRDRLLLLADFSTIATARDGTVPPGLPARAWTDQTQLMLAAGWEVHRDPVVTVDIFGGLRANWLGARVEVPPGVPGIARSPSYVDPIIGTRMTFRFDPRWSASLYADVGGFGVGSRFAVAATGLLNYAVNDTLTLSGGLRLMHVAYDDGNTKADITLAGPMLGISLRF